MVDSARLLEQTRRLNEAVTHPAFLRALQEVSELPEEARLEAASQTLNPQALAAQGVPIPKDMRITARYFEDPHTRMISSIGIGKSEAVAGRPNIIEELSKNPRLLAELVRTNPEAIKGVAETVALVPTICTSVGMIVCVTIGSEY